jgi:peptide/nickel transport system substrate-binding protein/oligopeptide transport system substrate-binding protein
MRKVLLLILIVAFSLAGCSLTDANIVQERRQPNVGGIYNYPLTGEPVSLDPAHITDSLEAAVSCNIHEGLVLLDEDMEIRPGIAESWERSPDGLTYEFKLRAGAKFHNGREIKPEDVVYSLKRLIDPSVNSERRNLFMIIEGADAYYQKKTSEVSGLQVTGERTVTIKLTHPLTPFLSILSMPNAAIVPKEEVEKENFGRKPVGAGPFCFESWIEGKEIRLSRYEDYYGTKPYLDGIKYHIIYEFETLMREFEQGAIDEAGIFVPEDERDRWEDQYGIQFLEHPTWGVQYIGLNTNIPPLDNKYVRQAINYAIDWDKYLGEGEIRAKGVLPPDMPGKNDAIGYTYDPAKAKELLVKAGYPQGIDREIELWVNYTPGDRLIGEFIKSELAQIGIKIKVGMMDWNDLTESSDRGKLQMFLIGWVADYPDPDTFLFPLFYSKNIGPNGNNTFYRNPKVDELLLQARRMELGEERWELYREIEEIIVDDAPWIFMYYYSSTLALQPWVHGREINGMGEGTLPLTKVWIE